MSAIAPVIAAAPRATDAPSRTVTSAPEVGVDGAMDPALDGRGAAVPSVSIATRERWLWAFARRIRLRHDELCSSVTEEIGKPAAETTLAELLPLLASIDWHRRAIRRELAPRRLGGAAWWQRGDRVWVERAPVGRVLIIATWNYPLQLLGIQLVQSIAAGNETWVKPSERSPRSQALLVRIAHDAMAEAGMPREALRLAPAHRTEGARLVREGHFDHILFTGSTSVGRSIAEVAAASLTPTTLELSGQDSAIVCADADARHAARSIWQALTMNAGQTCMAPRRVLVVRSAYRALLAELAPLAAAARPLRLIDEAAALRSFDVAADAVAGGGRSLSGIIERPIGASLRPLAIVDAPRTGELFRGEHFGPVIAIASVADVDEALALHAGVGQALSTSVYTRSPQAVRARAGEFGSSFVTINDSVRPTAHPAAAIVGRGSSGWGASRGRSGLLALTREVTVTSRGLFTSPPEMPSPSVLRWIRRFAGLAAPGGAPTGSGKDQ